MSISTLCLAVVPIIWVSRSYYYCNFHSLFNYHCHIFRNKFILILILIGPDGIHPHVLYEVMAFAKPLYVLFQQSITNSVLPSDWTDADCKYQYKMLYCNLD